MKVDPANNAQQNIASRLALLADRSPQRLALIHPTRRSDGGRMCYARLSLAQLERDSARLAQSLSSHGVLRGHRALVMLDMGSDLLRVVFALLRIGVVPIVVDSRRSIRDLAPCLDRLEPTLFVGSPAASISRRLARWSPPSLRGVVTAGAPWLWTGTTLDDLTGAPAGVGTFQPCVLDGAEPALILISDGGSSGPRAVTHSHAGLRAAMDSLVSSCGFVSGGLHLCSDPVMAILSPLMGMTSLCPSMNSLRPGLTEPGLLLELIEDLGPRFLSGSPILLDRLGQAARDANVELPSLEVVLGRGAPCSPETLAVLTDTLPSSAQVLLVYSSVENLAMATLSGRQMSTQDQTQALCLGRPLDSVELRILDVEEGQEAEPVILGVGEVGEIGFRAADSSPDAWHRTGDLGTIDDEGLLWFRGRKSDRLELPDGSLDTIPCELFFNSHKEVARSALIDRGAAASEPLIVIQSEVELSQEDQARLRVELLALSAERGLPIRGVLFHENIPVDLRHCSRINRRALASWARQQA